MVRTIDHYLARRADGFGVYRRVIEGEAGETTLLASYGAGDYEAARALVEQLSRDHALVQLRRELVERVRATSDPTKLAEALRALSAASTPEAGAEPLAPFRSVNPRLDPVSIDATSSQEDAA